MQVDDLRVRATGKAVPLPEPGVFPGDPGPLPKPAQQTSAYFQVCMQSTRHILILLITQLITLEHVKSHADNEPHHEQDH